MLYKLSATNEVLDNLNPLPFKDFSSREHSSGTV